MGDFLLFLLKTSSFLILLLLLSSLTFSTFLPFLSFELFIPKLKLQLILGDTLLDKIGVFLVKLFAFSYFIIYLSIRYLSFLHVALSSGEACKAFVSILFITDEYFPIMLSNFKSSEFGFVSLSKY